MSATNFKTENNTFRKLLGNGLTYRIPSFQRDYSWSDEEWEDLWADLTQDLEEKSAHYMGYLVLQSRDEKSFDVIDGQQRLATLSIVVLAALKSLQRLVESHNAAEPNTQRLNQIRQTYIGFLDPVTLLTKSKLTLNRNNDEYFQRYLIPLEKLPQRSLRASEHLLRKAFEWFDKRVASHVAAKGGDPGVVLAQFVEDMSDRLFFTVINVTDELNAYTVFETLNARGVKLSSTDLLKNYLFSVLHRETQSSPDIAALETQWEALVSRLGSEKFPEFLRVHWLSRGRFVRQADLFKAVRKEIGNRQQVFNLLREMDEDLDSYSALTHPESSLLAEKAKVFVRTLKLFGVRQPYPLLVSALRMLNESDATALLRACVVVSFRYNIIGGLSPSEQEPVYANIAKRITTGEFRNASDAIEALRGVYPSDEAFAAAFIDKSLPTSKERLVRYILGELERQEAPSSPIDEYSDALSVEHVLPKSPEAGWDQFNDDDREALTFRIGNLALLTKKANREVGNKGWLEKREVLRASPLVLTKAIAEENTEWTPERLTGRSRALAKRATAIWRISQLH